MHGTAAYQYQGLSKKSRKLDKWRGVCQRAPLTFLMPPRPIRLVNGSIFCLYQVYIFRTPVTLANQLFPLLTRILLALARLQLTLLPESRHNGSQGRNRLRMYYLSANPERSFLC